MYKIVFLFLLVLTACGSPENQPQKKDTGPIKTKPVSKKVETKPTASEFPRITNSNLNEFLTEYGKENKETILRLSCPYGDIDIRLYENTPLHRANMVYLTKRGYFDLTQFYRVSKDFVDQAGNSDELDCQEFRAKIGGYTLPAEFRTSNIHKYGAVAMARRYDKNPSKRSSPFEFYIALGRPYSEKEIRAHEREFGTSYTAEQKQIYHTLGGTPFLDNEHTVIGEVISGISVAEELNKVKVDNREWPLTEIPIKMVVIR
jgi:peptidyl-prolyl cis-trans isomerase B (cyclophilin B)